MTTEEQPHCPVCSMNGEPCYFHTSPIEQTLLETYFAIVPTLESCQHPTIRQFLANRQRHEDTPATDIQEPFIPITTETEVSSTPHPEDNQPIHFRNIPAGRSHMHKDYPTYGDPRDKVEKEKERQRQQERDKLKAISANVDRTSYDLDTDSRDLFVAEYLMENDDFASALEESCTDQDMVFMIIDQLLPIRLNYPLKMERIDAVKFSLGVLAILKSFNIIGQKSKIISHHVQKLTQLIVRSQLT